MSESIGEKRVQTTHQERLVAEDETDMRDENNIAESKEQHVEIDEAEKGQVDKRRVFSHLPLRKHPNREQIPE